MTNDMKIRQGARLDFTVERADPEAVSATFLAQSGTTTLTDTVEYVNGVAAFQFDNTDVIGVYEYQVMENFATGNPDIYPNQDECDGDCELPTLEICKSLSEA